MQPLALFDRLTLLTHDIDPMPIRADLHPVMHLLSSLGYDPEAIRRAVALLSMLGTAEGVEWIDEEDRAEVEALLPMAPAREWERYEGERWVANDR